MDQCPKVTDFWMSDLIHLSQQLPFNNKVVRRTSDNSKKFFLVQFSKHPQNLIHAILTKNEVSIPIQNDANSSDILIDDGRQIMPGTLLFSYEIEEFVNDEFQKLKFWSFQKGFDESDISTTIGPNYWILVLYTCHKGNVVYTIINNRDTFQGIHNHHADVVCYLNFGNDVYQAIIIRKSEKYEEVFEALTAIKDGCLQLRFPLKHDSSYTGANAIPPFGYQSYCGTIDEFLKINDSKNHAILDASLTNLEKKMQGDALVLLEWVSSLEHMKSKAEQQINHLTKSSEITKSTNIFHTFTSPGGSNKI